MTVARLTTLAARIEAVLLAASFPAGWLPKVRKYVIPDIGGVKVGAVVSPKLPADSFTDPASVAAHARSVARLSVMSKPSPGAAPKIYRHYHIERPSDIGKALKRVRNGVFGGAGVDPRRQPRTQWRKMRPDEEFSAPLSLRRLARDAR